jgi:hypothetical protein
MKTYLLTYLLSLFTLVSLIAQETSISLFEYPDNPQTSLSEEQKITYEKLSALGTIHYVNLNNIKQVGIDGVVEVDLPASQMPTLHFEVKNAHIEANGNLYWYGTLPISPDTTNDLTGSMHFNIYNGKQFGTFSVDSLTFNFFDLGNNEHVLIQMDLEGTNPYIKCTAGNTPDTTISNILDNFPERISKNENQVEFREFCNEVDVLVLHTPRAADRVGGNDIVEQIAVNEIIWSNQAFDNSAVGDINLNFVGLEEIAFTEDVGEEPEGDFLEIINNFSELREEASADIVVVLTFGEYIREAIWGEAELAGTVLEIGPADESAYCLVEIDHASADRTFTHEVGHLFGCRHQPEADNTETFAKAHLFRRCFFCKRQETIMHTALFPNIFGNTPKTIQHFSNPDVNYFPNRATGIANERDNARQLDEAVCTVATYRESSEDLMHIEMIRSNECVAPGSKMLITTQVEGGGDGIPAFEWRWSFDGINYSNVLGTNSSFLVTLQTFSHTLFVQVKVTTSDGQMKTGTIIINVNSDCPYVDESTSLWNNNQQPTLILYSPQPNPARELFRFEILVKETQNITLTLCDANGVIKKTINNGKLPVGLHEFEVNTSDYNIGGVFYLNLRGSNETHTQQLLISK